MATITLKNLPASLHRALRQQAKTNNRSINRETIDCLERVILGKAANSASLLENIRSQRAATPGKLTEQMLRTARSTGRP